METEMTSLVTKEDLAKLERKIDEVKSEVLALQADIKALTESGKDQKYMMFGMYVGLTVIFVGMMIG